MKTVYLVRHGESEDNIEDAKPLKGEAAALTERGRSQARSIGARCAKLDIDVVLASTYPRAKETADIINARIQKPIEYIELFTEWRHPSAWNGKQKVGRMRLHELIDAHIHVSDFRYADEESTNELGRRCDTALRYIEKRPEENIVIVSHAIFLRGIVARVLFGDAVTVRETAQCLRVLKLANTGLSILRYDPDDVYGSWRVVCWNDHAHLAD